MFGSKRVIREQMEAVSRVETLVTEVYETLNREGENARKLLTAVQELGFVEMALRSLIHDAKPVDLPEEARIF